MRKFSTYIFLLSVIAGQCFAQSGASSNVAITATIIRGISIASSRGLLFGVIPTGTGIHSLPSDAPSVGSFTVTGQSGSNVSVTFPGSVALHDGTGNVITFSPAVPIWNTANSQSVGAQVFPMLTGGTASFGSGGGLYIWFGGSINSDSAAVGSYSEDYTMSVTH